MRTVESLLGMFSKMTNEKLCMGLFILMMSIACKSIAGPLPLGHELKTPGDQTSEKILQAGKNSESENNSPGGSEKDPNTGENSYFLRGNNNPRQSDTHWSVCDPNPCLCEQCF